MWINWKSYPDELSYPLSGLFVEELIAQYGKENFLEFFKNQTYKNAQKVFGKGLKIFIEKFENRFNE